jgi:hypothetical protein
VLSLFLVHYEKIKKKRQNPPPFSWLLYLMTTETKGGFYMTIFEHIFSVIGILIIIGGFIYGIYDSYFEGKGTSSSKASASTSAQTTDAV